MTGSEIHRRVFIVGVPRSGTTLVQSLLAAHSELTSFTESHFFAGHFTQLPWLATPVLTRNPAPRVKEFLAENSEQPTAAARRLAAASSWALRIRPLLPPLTRPVARQLIRVFDELALRRGVQNWVEKTPRHLHYIPFLEKVVGGHPPPHFVHVLRDGLEVVASLYRASREWERSYNLETCVERWNREVAFSLERAGSPNDHFVFYEELVSRPDVSVERLLVELGLGWEREIPERYSRTTDRLVTDQESWKTKVGLPIRPSATSSRVLDAAQRARVLRSLRHDLYSRLATEVRETQRRSFRTD